MSLIAKQLSPVLIANRGEVARRVIRACRELGLRSVAVYSQADADAPHTREADEAIEIGPAEARQSYLNAERILAAAKQSGAKALHPGYGFLAENADFADAVSAAGLIWVGPPPAAMRAMGDKAKARILMEKAGVPVLPGYQGPDDATALLNAATQIGFPVLVKAAAGGGGVGQRVVSAAGEMDEAIQAARREAKNAFNDEHLIIEKYLARARHIEVQVLGDEHRNLVHLFERECSLQRRRQKIVEETPSPFLDPELRAAMTAAAVDAASAVGYTNAGTVEFLVDPASRQFYFLEMNTRLQVEHSITELTTGADIVQWQLRIAAGEKLSLKQGELKQSGHAIECRLYAEETSAGFLPQGGRIHKLLLPEDADVRVDSSVSEGGTVGVHYDPLLAKLSVHASSRPAALERMRQALSQTAFLGVTNNANFLQDLLMDADVQAGNYDTRFVEENIDRFIDRVEPTKALIAAALLDTYVSAESGQPGEENEDPHSPWTLASGFRMGSRQ